MAGRFKKRCASESLHRSWDVHLDESAPLKKAHKKIEDTLLMMSGKSKSIHYKKSEPKFCQGCMNKISELHPELCPEKTGTDHSYTVPSRPATFVAPSVRHVCVQTEPVLFLDDPKMVCNLSDEIKSHLAYHLGLDQHVNVMQDSTLLSTSSRDIDTLNDINVTDYWEDRNTVVKAFVLGISNKPSTDCPKKEDIYKMCKTVESIMNMTGTRLVLPLHFKESVVLYSMTRSKIALHMMAHSSPHGSYQAVRQWVANLGTEAKFTLPGDVIAAFDNNQVMHRNWNIQLGGKFNCHTVTMVVFFKISAQGSLQWETSLKPGVWRIGGHPESVPLDVKEIDKIPLVKDTHYKHLHDFLVDVISEVASQQIQQPDGNGHLLVHDGIDAKVKEQAKENQYKMCYACGKTDVPKRKVVCPACKQNIKKSKLDSQGVSDKVTFEEKQPTKCEPKTYRVLVTEKEDKSLHVQYEESGQTSDQGEVPITQSNVSDPVFVNPCSYDANEIVLRNIGIKAGIAKYGTGNRTWLTVFCDGSPYILCSRIIESTYRCELCKVSVSGLDQASTHMTQHHSRDPTMLEMEFDWVVLQPGPGHVEMNMVKGIVELCWEPFWKEMIYLYNFKSENAQKAAKRVSDHHKGWQMLRIARKALAKEMVLPYVREQLCKKEQDLSPASFFKFMMKEVKDNTYTFIADVLFEFIDSIFMYREGVRTGNDKFVFSGRAKFAKLWSGRVHPLYRELEMKDSISLARMPTEILQHVQAAWSLNTSGKPGTSEGPDFKLEEINRQTQRWVPGVPSGQDWQAACSNYDELTKFRELTYKQIGILDPKNKNIHKQRDLQKEEDAFRVLLRERKYLSNPRQRREITSLGGEFLDPELVKFLTVAREKRAKLFDAFISTEVLSTVQRTKIPFSENPIFITQEERDRYMSIAAKTVKELKQMNASLLTQISDDDMREAFEEAWTNESKKRKSMLKQDYINFHNELCEYLENVEAYATDILGDTSEDEDSAQMDF